MIRREFLKLAGCLPFLGIFKKVEKPKVKPAKEQGCPERKPYKVYQFHIIQWDNRWWRFQGNKVEWTEPNCYERYSSGREFANWFILPTKDVCVDVITANDTLIWVGENGERWTVERYGDDPQYRFTKLELSEAEYGKWEGVRWIK